MALIICPECGGKVSDKAAVCPHCGCARDVINEVGAVMPKNDSENEIDDEEQIDLPLAGYELSFDKRLEEYLDLRREFEFLARVLRLALRDIYEKTSLERLIERVPELVESTLADIVDKGLNRLYELGIPISPETFIGQYYDNSTYGINYNEKISRVVEKYADILGERDALTQYRELQKASRSRWQGGGFGLKGAVKGALMAGALNAGADFIRSFGDYERERTDNAYIQQKIDDLKQSDFARGQIDYFTLWEPERNLVPLHQFSFANHRFAFEIHPIDYYLVAHFSRMLVEPVSSQNAECA